MFAYAYSLRQLFRSRNVITVIGHMRQRGIGVCL